MASQLPPEILLDIFAYLPRHAPLYWSGIDAPAAVTWSIALVCRGWHGSATEFLYRSVCVMTARSAQQLCWSLQVQPSLRVLIKVITLPRRGPGQLPSPIVNIFAQIINMIDSLERVDSPVNYLQRDTWEQWSSSDQILPIAPGRHRNLSHLGVAGNYYRDGTLVGQITSFQTLRVLELSAIRLQSPVDPHTTPILPVLEKIILSFCDNLAQLDEWLVACPRLRAIELICVQMLTPNPKILTCGKITRVGLLDCWSWSEESRRWFVDYKRFQSLSISLDVFQKYLHDFPRSVGTMQIRFKDWEHLPREHLQRYMDTKPSLDNIILQYDEANVRMMYIKDDLAAICDRCGVTVSFEISSFVERLGEFPHERLAHAHI